MKIKNIHVDQHLLKITKAKRISIYLGSKDQTRGKTHNTKLTETERKRKRINCYLIMGNVEKEEESRMNREKRSGNRGSKKKKKMICTHRFPLIGLCFWGQRQMVLCSAGNSVWRLKLP